MHLRDVFAQLAQFSTAITLRLLRRVRLGFARQMLWQRTPRRFPSWSSNKDRRGCRWTLGWVGLLAVRLELFQPQLQLLDLPLPLLCLASELHALQIGAQPL